MTAQYHPDHHELHNGGDLEAMDVKKAKSNPASIRGLETSPETSLKKGLQARHVNMIAIGGAIGTGLIIGTGKALAQAGPGSLLISYTFVGGIVFLVMAAMGEMTAWLPLSAGFTGYASRYCHPSLGFALGWTYLFKYLIMTPNQLTAAALVLQFWVPREKVNPGVFIVVFLIVILFINFWRIGVFGEVEFWLSTFKVLVIVGIMIFALVLIVGGGPDHEVRGFRYWSNPGAFKEYIASGAWGKALGFWSTMINATFAYQGTELVGVTVAEAQNPRKTIPKAIKMTFYRILLFYCISVFLLGMLVPYDSPELSFAVKQKASASASPFVAAATVAGVQVMPHIINGCICLTILSAANTDLYIASRTLYGLASDGKAPAIFKRTNNGGTPIYALAVAAVFALLAFMNVSDDSTKIFGYFVNITTIFGLLTWISILVTHIFWCRARKAQSLDSATLPYAAPFGIWGSYCALVVCIFIALTKNFDVFTRWDQAPFHVEKYKTFITGYIGIPVYLVLIFGHKFVTKSGPVRPEETDFFTGKDIVDNEERLFLEHQALRQESTQMARGWNLVYKRFVAWLF
ncbi:unnamed protein product [Clonostachys rhizophaga]|uniref:Amino acid permease/ SLC12A domain-containing protein n=1 Tax=Clonostachys rhizophaga TaxID=160324 RepID=A0A9N9YNU8_9HYPO|nr:unnamed protein product [Clonostachys rhizophaga]